MVEFPGAQSSQGHRRRHNIALSIVFICVIWLPSSIQVKSLLWKLFSMYSPLATCLRILQVHIWKERGSCPRPTESYSWTEPWHLHFNNYSHYNLRTIDLGVAWISLVIAWISLVIIQCDTKECLNTTSYIQGIIWSFPHPKFRQSFQGPLSSKLLLSLRETMQRSLWMGFKDCLNSYLYIF